METKGRLKDVARDFFSGKWKMTFEVDSLPDTDELSGHDLRLIAKKWREKRSLNANAYFHVLVDKIAKAIGSSSTEVKNNLMSEYGTLLLDGEGKPKVHIMPDDDEWNTLDIRLRPTNNTSLLDDGKLYRVYLRIKPSHLYDTKEMSDLIDGTVYEAKELGIETMTPNELASLMSKWKPKEEKELRNAG